ncbi:hypothetical protein COLO4_29154 [Corchorus olitorius]|uniref:Uncharacterized protein n=1 Tax=Corchorus olitorius TaxID=93759 RepID=A0A1R3HG01_9ROSI|nr:hypothetical protein COLO4_29154 [Corchorus olitorius]
MGAGHSMPPQPDYNYNAFRDDAQFESKEPALPTYIIDPDSFSWRGFLCRRRRVGLIYGSIHNKDVTVMSFEDAKVASDEFDLLDSLDNRYILKPSNLILKTDYSSLERACSYINFPNKLFTWKDWLDMKMNEFWNKQGLSWEEWLDMKKKVQDLSKYKRLWWQFIKPDFKKIFRSFIHPCFILDSPFFWNALEKTQFSENFVRTLDFDILDYHILDESFIALNNWTEEVPRDPPYWSILQEETDYDRGLNIHKYIRNCSDVKPLEEIEKFLPDTYWKSIESLLLAAEKTSNYAKCHEAVKKLFANKDRDRGY